MPKAKKNLVIVESPSKAKTIAKYLGPDYEVKASMGHLRDLQKSTMSVDIEHDFEPEYYPIKGKEDIIDELKKAAKGSEIVYLATDPDREGEAISWHLQYLLGLPEEKTKRVTFNEITKNVVRAAIEHPRAIDKKLVDAQQARRVLDRIVGYQLSPLLWKKIRKGLSAGRVQSVATRMVVDRENEIRNFVPEESWTVDAELARVGKPGSFIAHYYGSPEKRVLTCEADVQQLLGEIEGKPFSVKSVQTEEKQSHAAPPFTTSTMQQAASGRLNMTPKRTMMIAQQLYEGVEITGEGSVGLITYMRTDSVRVSEEAQRAARQIIESRYGRQYYPPVPNVYKTKGTAQDAHEAIRPSNVALTPELVEKDLNKDQFRLYKLIWNRFVASQMANAVYDDTTIEAVCAPHDFHAKHRSPRFAGYTAVYEDSRDEDQEYDESPLPELTVAEELRLQNTEAKQHFSQPSPRYTEATLVKAMEEKGVGRPSTYATIVSTIQDREYVLKKAKSLYPTPLGEVVNGLMMDRFQKIINIEFTADMEKQLDRVEEGKREWKSVLADFYKDFHREMQDAEEALKDTRLKVPDEVTDEICELCGRNMVVKTSRFGKFLACPGYPECKNTKPIVERMPGRCPKCGSTILKRKSKRGYAYYACERGAQCGFMTWDVPTDKDCPVCGQTMFKRAGKGAMKPFCTNEACSEFLPEDKRGYRRKPAAADDAAKPEAEETKKKKPAKKTAAKKTAKKKESK